MKNILIVGATGLIGSHLLNRMCKTNAVTVLGRKKPEKISVAWIEQDLTQDFDHTKLPDNTDVIIYLAQSEHFRDFPEYAQDVFTVNTIQVLKLLDFARKNKIKQFIFASSGGVYGSGEQSFSETLEINTNSNLGFYLSTKLCTEILARNYTSYMSVIVLRFFFVYGKNQRESMLIPRLISCVEHDRPITLQGKNGILLNPTHVSDAVNAIEAAMGQEYSDCFNICGPDVVSLRQVCEIIGELTGETPNFFIESGGEPSNIIGNIDKMKAKLCTPKIGIREGLEKILS